MQRNINESAQKKRRKDAKNSAAFSILYLLLIGSLLIGLRFYYKVEGIGGFLLLLFGILNILSTIPVGILLKTRLKEIEGGEEDVATQY